MKTHVRNTVLGGILLPIALLLAALIANEGQILLGLNLDRVSLAIFLLPFLYGCAEVIKALLHHGAMSITKEFVGSLLGGGGVSPENPPGPVISDLLKVSSQPTPPPPPPPGRSAP